MAGSSHLVKELRENRRRHPRLPESAHGKWRQHRQGHRLLAPKRPGRRAEEIRPRNQPRLIHAYIHMGGKIGVLIEVNCETDFVARNEELKTFVNDLALQVAAGKPSYVKREEFPPRSSKKNERFMRDRPRKWASRLPHGRRSSKAS